MLKDDKSIEVGKRVIALDADSVKALLNRIDSTFSAAVDLVYEAKGRVIVTGLGKSGAIARKISGTLTSTGTTSYFLHAAEGAHGDIGMVHKDDVVICISKSGNTPEIKVLVPLIKNSGNKIIAITGNPDSFLGKNADHVLNSYVEKEACPNNLAPTTSTTAQLVVGDALAVCLLNMKDFTSRDFAKYHPGGTLGKKLYLRVSDLVVNNEVPQVSPDASIKDVIVEISEKRLGTTAVVEGDRLIGIITDGDIRRMLEKNADIKSLTAADVMSADPIRVESETMAVEALDVMEDNNITQILVTENGKYVGVVHFHDLLKEGII